MNLGFAISELKELHRIYKRENDERRFDYIQAMEILIKEGKTYQQRKKEKYIKWCKRKIKLEDKHVRALAIAIGILEDHKKRKSLI